MNDLIQRTAIKNWLQATADDGMGMEPGDRAMANEALKEIEQLEAKVGKTNHYIIDNARQAEKIEQLEAENTKLQAAVNHACSTGKILQMTDRIEQLEAALRSIVGQTDDQFHEGVWREVNSTAKAALGGEDAGCSLCDDPLARMPSWENHCPRCLRALPVLVRVQAE